MRHVLFLVLLTAVCVGAHIPSGANVFIEPMEGFEDYLAAALHAKQVPLVVVTERDKADFVISGSAGSSEIQHHTRATIKVVDRKGTVVFAYAFDQDYAMHGKQTAAEACAKNLKREIQ
jgi:hypothetical protein